jgi:2-keto-4-pentenoate hydratase/2-oxohepta-3-ene-1,7-dioic acid hydratase in catechol pathway
MRLGRVLFANVTEPAVLHQDTWVRVSCLGLPDLEGGIACLLSRSQELLGALDGVVISELVARGDAVPAASAHLQSPLERTSSIIAVGLNYRAHIAEVEWKAPTNPLLFAKWSSALTGPYNEIALDASLSQQVDYEVELVAVIGRHTRDVDVAHALEHIGGYAVANDVSARDVQKADSQWTRAKSFDGFCPIGPWITTADEVADPQDLELSCVVNGSVRQHANTAQMIFGVAELVAFASHGMTLHPGDVLLTGTPSGVALGSESPQWLKPGDVVRSEIAGLGYLENHITARAAAEAS